MKTFVLILSMILCSNLNGQQGKFLLSSFRNDGNGNVSSENFTFSKKAKFYYFISNDKANVYLDLKIDDSEVQSRILLQGLTLWINMDGKSAKKMGVHFPIGSQHSGGRRGQNTQGANLDSEGKPLTPLAQANTIELLGFISEESRRFPADNADSFSGSVSYDKEGVLHYKLKMPLVKIPVRNAKEGGGAMPFTLGIEYGFDPNANGNMEQGMKPLASAGAGESGGGGGGGGSRGGSSGGGRSGGRGQVAVAPSISSGSYSAQAVAPPVEFWIKNIKLATEK
jgi:hypothetical protein